MNLSQPTKRRRCFFVGCDELATVLLSWQRSAYDRGAEFVPTSPKCALAGCPAHGHFDAQQALLSGRGVPFALQTSRYGFLGFDPVDASGSRTRALAATEAGP